jgi:hypothetical protein
MLAFAEPAQQAKRLAAQIATKAFVVGAGRAESEFAQLAVSGLCSVAADIGLHPLLLTPES